MVGWSVCHNFLKRWEVPLPCFYRNTYWWYHALATAHNCKCSHKQPLDEHTFPYTQTHTCTLKHTFTYLYTLFNTHTFNYANMNIFNHTLNLHSHTCFLHNVQKPHRQIHTHWLMVSCIRMTHIHTRICRYALTASHYTNTNSRLHKHTHSNTHMLLRGRNIFISSSHTPRPSSPSPSHLRSVTPAA